MLEQGTIYGIPLEHNLGYAYVKCILTDLLGYTPYLMLKAFNFHTEELDRSIISSQNKVDELCYRFLMLGKPVVRGKDRWYKIGVSNLSEEESARIPDFKQNGAYMMDIIEQSEWSLLHWDVIHGLNLADKTFNVSYDKIKHLGIWIHSADVAIRRRLTMIWIKKKGLDIQNFYKGDSFIGTKNIWNLFYLNEASNIVFYDEMPKEFRGRIISS